MIGGTLLLIKKKSNLDKISFIEFKRINPFIVQLCYDHNILKTINIDNEHWQRKSTQYEIHNSIIKINIPKHLPKLVKHTID